MVKTPIPILNNIKAADLVSLGSMNVLSFLSNGSNYKKGKDFNLLKPVYDVTNKTIEDLIKSIIKKEYPLSVPSGNK